MRLTNLYRYVKELSIIKIIIFTISIIGIIFLIINESINGGGDFQIYHAASKFLFNGDSPYYKWITLKDGEGGQFSYSPFFLLFFSPLFLLKLEISIAIWLILDMFYIYRIWVILKKMVNLEFSKKEIYLFSGITFIFIIRFFYYDFDLVQTTTLILFLSIESIWQIKNKKIVLGSFLLAIGILFKILPIVLLPYLIYRKEIKSFSLTILFSIILLFLPVLFFGFKEYLHLLQEWYSVINPTNSEFFDKETASSINRLSVLLSSLFNKDIPSKLNFRRYLFDLDIKYVKHIIHIAQTSLIIYTLFFLRTLPFKKAKSLSHQLWEISYIFLMIPLLFPHQQKYLSY